MTPCRERKKLPRRCAAAVLAAFGTVLSGLPAIVLAEEMVWVTALPEPEPRASIRNFLTITPGYAAIVRYAQEPGTVIVGNADIAVASIAAADLLVLTGLRAGVTNVIVLDDDGNEIDQIELRVAVPGNTIVVRRQLERQVMRCDPRCAPADDSGIATGTALPLPAPSAVAPRPEAIPVPGD